MNYDNYKQQTPPLTNAQKLAQLNNIYESTVQLNAEKNFMQSIEKSDVYFNLLLKIKKEKHRIWVENRNEPRVAENLETAKKAVINYLTNPIL